MSVPTLRTRSVLIVVSYLILSIAFCAPLFARAEGLGVQDWDAHLFYYGSVLKSVVEYGQLPFWNPWYCGGNVLWQNPQVSIISPVYPLVAVVSLPLAVKLNIVFHYWISFVGMHLLLTRVVGLSFLPVIGFLGSVFTLAGAPVLHLAVGHNNFLPAFYLPLQLFWFLRALNGGRLRDVCLASLVLALMVFEGGVHMVPMAYASIGMCAVIVAVGRRSWRPLALAALFGVLSGAYAAPKLLPITMYARSPQFFDARNPTEHPDRMNLDMVARAYTDGYQNRSVKYDIQRIGWYEYGNYIGVLGALLILASLIWIVTNRRSPDWWFGAALAATSLIMLMFSAGEFAWWAPASLAAHVPFFSSFRIPSRYTFVAVLFGVASAGWTFQTIGIEKALGNRAMAFLAIVCVLAVADLFVRNGAQLRGSFPGQPFESGFRVLGGPHTLEIDAESDPYQLGSPMFRALMHDRSFYKCYEGLQVRPTADATHPLVFGDGNAKIFTTDFTPNRVEFTAVAGNESSRVMLNQNMADGWTSTTGPVVPDRETSRPSLTLAPGQAGKVAFTFVPPGLMGGTALFLIAAIASLFIWNRRLEPR